MSAGCRHRGSRPRSTTSGRAPAATATPPHPLFRPTSGARATRFATPAAFAVARAARFRCPTAELSGPGRQVMWRGLGTTRLWSTRRRTFSGRDGRTAVRPHDRPGPRPRSHGPPGTHPYSVGAVAETYADAWWDASRRL